MFHLLRMQALAFDRRPLIVMTPKSLLRHAEAVSTLDELAHGAFRELLPDEALDAARDGNVERVIVTSGKAYFELLDYRRKHGIDDTPIIRVEQLVSVSVRRARGGARALSECEARDLVSGGSAQSGRVEFRRAAVA